MRIKISITKSDLLSCLWIFIIIFSLIIFVKYSTKPTHKKGFKELSWPTQTNLNTNSNSSLVIFLHPHCPCSRASVRELERLIPQIKDKLQITAIFVIPESRDEIWAKSDLYESLKNYSFISIIFDYNYKEAEKFNAKTSGEVFLYNKDKSLVFNGAITPSRGHEGDSLGQNIILNYSQNKFDKYPIIINSFGCSLKELEQGRI